MTIERATRNQISRRELMIGAGGVIASSFLNYVPSIGAEKSTLNDGELNPPNIPLHVFCGTGDHLWGSYLEPVDSRTTIEAMWEWMTDTYQISRVYWRGGQSMMWHEYFKIGPEHLLSSDWTKWKQHLYRDLKINEIAVSAAHARGMEVFMYSGLFEFGVQPDIGVVGPYPFEDQLRKDHPEWCSMDRWGERRCPGPISFCYPQARKVIIDRYIKHIEKFGYDGICFYTYVENCGILYEDEFGFNQPIVDKFQEKYPDIDLRSDQLSPEQKQHWYECRGSFVTEFLRELHAELSKRGKKLSVIIDANDPDYAQPWWSQKFPGTGKIKMDWRRWVREGIVEELWVQLAPTKNQRETLDTLREECTRHGVKLTVRAVEPFESGWKPYVKSGVTPIAVITWKVNGIEKFTRQEIDQSSLQSNDWKVRLQALTDVEEGRLNLAPEQVAELSNDSHVLVRRRCMYALAALKAKSHVSFIERGLFDKESSVRIAAASALKVTHRQHSAQQILAAVEKDGYFQMKLASVEALSAMKEIALDNVLAGLKSKSSTVREVSVRSLCHLGKSGFHKTVYPVLSNVVLDREEDETIRCHALEGIIDFRQHIASDDQATLTQALIDLASEEPSLLVQNRAAWALGFLFETANDSTRNQIVDCLTTGFKIYGDDCQSSDAAYGWRIWGNSLIMCHERGQERLESMRTQKRDKWLAWLAYEVVYLPHREMKMALIDEKEAVERHQKYAPPFPGYRT